MNQIQINKSDKPIEIDENLYSRQLYTIGLSAMTAIKNSSVLISGLTGIGVEIAKCVILGGVKSVMLHDTTNIKIKDLSSNYYISSENIGQNRAKSVHEKLAKLNNYVDVKVLTDELTEDHFKEYTVIVICDQFPSSQFENNKLARKYKTKYILVNTIGVMGSIFCDFNNFTTTDSNGELPSSGILLKIKDNCFVTHEQHNLSVNDKIKITCDGVEITCIVDKINGLNEFKVSEDTEFEDNDCLSNCSYTEIKKEIRIKFKSLEKSIVDPDFVTIISDDFERPMLLHNIQNVLDTFCLSNSRLPQSNNNDDMTHLLIMLADKSGFKKNVDNILKKYTNDQNSFVGVFGNIIGQEILNLYNDQQKEVITKIFNSCNGKFCPIDSIIGSIAAQEVLKACSNKYTPITQWFYLDFANIIPNEKINNYAIDDDDCNNRYSAQISIFGQDIQKKLEESTIFIVGAGAIGCELLKNLAMIGIGNIVITDMDMIEKSNLNRQFLFSYSDIGKFKSEAAKNSILQMNSKINIISQINKISQETSSVYDKDFFNKITCVMTALDNVPTRLYVDKLCCINSKPFIDSGTLGTKGSVQCIIPHITELYGSTQDPPEQTIPLCTLKNFPYLIEHCIQWGRDLFEGMFNKAPKNYMKYKEGIFNVDNMTPSELAEISDDILLIHNNGAIHQKECIKFAYNLWFDYFRDQIHNLIIKYPEDNLTKEGMLFWSGTKRFPKVLEFNANELNLQFIQSTANLWADVFSLPHVTIKQIQLYILKTKIPDIKILSESESDSLIDNKKNDKENIKENVKQVSLPKKEELKYNVQSIDFEKDNDNNFHIDFVTSISNIRAENYNIPKVDKFKTKGIAGKIIPALITTTSLVSGLACIELIKIIQKINTIEKYTNTFVNIALPLVAFSEPVKIKKQKIGKYEFTEWNKLVFENKCLKDIINDIKKIIDEDISIQFVYYEQYTLFSTLNSEKTQEERLNMKISDIISKICLSELPKEIMINIYIDIIGNKDSNQNSDSDSDSDSESNIEQIQCQILFE